MRCFIALKIPEVVKKKIHAIQDMLPSFYGKFTELENLHLTLKFLGEIEEEKLEKIREKLKEIKLVRFDVNVKELGVFSESFVKIVWLHLVGGEELQRLIDSKIEELGFVSEKRFMSHLTIARVKTIRDREKFLEDLYAIEIPEIEFKAEKFYLIKSELKKQGPEYTILEEYNLF
jgi:2'-5' RNA ligase